MELTLIQKIVVFAIPVIFAITLHEAAHGYAALRFGDRTAKMLGRITLNPLKHIDPIGTILVPLITYLAGGILFGWAKPVPVNFSNLRRPKQDMFWVAAAGPGANILMALFWGAVIKLVHFLPLTDYSQPLLLMGAAGVTINAVLAALNLLPIPPLDGGRIAVSLLPPRWAYGLARVEPYGMFILIALIFTGLLSAFIGPVYSAIEQLTYFIFGL
ncbi:MAG: site-2 protease family protein [Hydrogenophilales bacterium CG03_land_8_20_14_0_80_62_28]|nr:site-2 protease family protein [Betaproteobacteria bacterium]OIO77182.1 MAG: site-2 protease family protein [Hydrogenophilaceae bacterium CG1_02_62_390]PIV22567.1 MAG: site-2 protease family protein [Hydrogenophilales bacterium CG03_land_8_20_14_0_80_62_28]PIW39344.1 MAG: site-2 protease family protein [Hydrogenophilales bacterium CG15_BIG_FIL_POST_REV_8_21_14_020_62_31]PIW71061.1 MAG: site-2 protease family protein [Hydrogenophilales bacterium CG12_big_fil_rev_8_21_14_0_65_61_21]PIX02289.1